MAEYLTGKPVSDRILTQLRDVCSLSAHKPHLATVRVGERADDQAYERSLIKRCESMGFVYTPICLPSSVTDTEMCAQLETLNHDPHIDGILMFQPLPDKLSAQASRIRNTICCHKDVDGITDASLSGVFLGSTDVFSPCTAQACLEILKYYGISLSGANVVVVGRSYVVGRPLAALLLSQNATVTVCHTKTSDLGSICKRADILIAAAGSPKLISESCVRSDQIVLDVGIHEQPDGLICGDVDMDAVYPIVRAITPVPGGVGSVTTAVLLSHVVDAMKRRGEQL